MEDPLEIRWAYGRDIESDVSKLRNVQRIGYIAFNGVTSLDVVVGV